MKTRILVAIPIGLILIAALVLQSWVLVALFALLSFIAQVEMMRTLDAQGAPVVRIVPFIFAAATIFLLYYYGPGMLFVAFILCVMALFIITMINRRYNFDSLLKSVFIMIYPQMFFAFAYLLVYQFTNMRVLGSNPVVLVAAFLPPIFCDIFAYFFGCAFGKKKLCPEISPKKTVAGSIAGLAGGLIAGLLIWMFMASGIFIHALYWDMGVVPFILLGVIVAGVSQLGDLGASFVKRHFSIKDFGTLLPGHGGILDRIDSLLFSLPIVYIYFIVYNSYANAIV